MSETRRRFLAGLAKLVQPDNAEEAATALIAMLPMLTDIPEDAFASRECLNRVSTAKRRTVIPAFGDIVAAMNSWVREQPGRPLLADPRATSLSDMDQMWVQFFERREAERFGPVGNRRATTRESCLAFVRSQSLQAWSYLTGEPFHTERGEPTEAECAAVAEAAARFRADTPVPASASVADQMAAVRGSAALANAKSAPLLPAVAAHRAALMESRRVLA